MKLGLLVPDAPWRDLPRAVEAARTYGATSLWFVHGDGIVAAAAATPLSGIIEIGVLAPTLQKRPPVLLARQLMTLQLLVRGTLTVAVRTEGERTSLEAAIERAYEPKATPSLRLLAAAEEDIEDAVVMLDVVDRSTLETLATRKIDTVVLSLGTLASL